MRKQHEKDKMLTKERYGRRQRGANDYRGRRMR